MQLALRDSVLLYLAPTAPPPPPPHFSPLMAALSFLTLPAPDHIHRTQTHRKLCVVIRSNQMDSLNWQTPAHCRAARPGPAGTNHGTAGICSTVGASKTRAHPTEPLSCYVHAEVIAGATGAASEGAENLQRAARPRSGYTDRQASRSFYTLIRKGLGPDWRHR